MATEDKEQKHVRAILDALNNTIEKGQWGDNLFFQAMLKKLTEVRERLKRDTHLVESNSGQGMPTTLYGRVAQRSGLVEAYILLYNADGNNIPKWESALQMINKFIVSRPIYRHENEVKAALRAATNKMNEGYAVVFIHEEDIIKPSSDQCPHDRYGNELLVLREGAVKRENITRFVHKTGNYKYEDDKLEWASAVEFI